MGCRLRRPFLRAGKESIEPVLQACLHKTAKCVGKCGAPPARKMMMESYVLIHKSGVYHDIKGVINIMVWNNKVIVKLP